MYIRSRRFHCRSGLDIYQRVEVHRVLWIQCPSRIRSLTLQKLAEIATSTLCRVNPAARLSHLHLDAGNHLSHLCYLAKPRKGLKVHDIMFMKHRLHQRTPAVATVKAVLISGTQKKVPMMPPTPRGRMMPPTPMICSRLGRWERRIIRLAAVLLVVGIGKRKVAAGGKPASFVTCAMNR